MRMCTPYNRITVELKLKVLSVLLEGIIPYNRITVELKYSSSGGNGYTDILIIVSQWN